MGLAHHVIRHGSVRSLTEAAVARGVEPADVVKTMVFLTDMAEFAAMNALYVEAFDGHRPARSTICVAGLPLGACVEIEAWAYVGPS